MFASIRKALGVPEGRLILEYLETLDPKQKSEKVEVLEGIELGAAMKAELFPGTQDIFARLSKLKIKAGILTRNCARVMSWFLEAHPELRVDHAITRELAAPKPNPDGLQVFLKRWEIAPSELLMVGDSYLDMECGLNAGAQTVWFKQKISNMTVEVDYVIEHLGELSPIVERP